MAVAVATGLLTPALAATAAGAGTGDPGLGPALREPSRPQPTGRAIVLVEPPSGVTRRGGAVAAGSRPEVERVRARIGAIVDRAGVRAETRIPELGAVAVRPRGDGGVAAVRRATAGDPAVADVQPEYRRFLRLVPGDPAFAASHPRAPLGSAYQWHLREERFRRAWGLSRGNHARVAVIDTGIDATNPDLAERLVAAVDQEELFDTGPATVDHIGHGTHIAGLACATSDNSYGGASAGFRCRLIVQKSDLTDASIARSIVDSTKRGADVINMSFGGPGGSKVIVDALRHAWRRDVILVAAASNANVKAQGLPARYLQPQGSGPDLGSGRGLVVTAAQYDGNRAFFKPGRGKGISLAAYGAASEGRPGIFSNFPANLTELDTGIPELTPPCECRTSFEGDDRFAYLVGTSFAAPQVSGAAALIRSRRRGIDAEKVIRIIKRKAGGTTFKGKLGWGILNAGAALRRLVG